MSATVPGLGRTIRRRLRTGPNAAVKQGGGWRWDEAGWCLVVIGWFGTAGRPIDLLVAGALVVYWLVGPAVGIVVVGNLGILALGIRPTALLPFVATELVLTIPMAIEFRIGSADPTAWAARSAAALALVGAGVAGVQGGLSPRDVGALLGVLYLLGVVGLHVWDMEGNEKKNRERTESDAGRTAEAAGGTESS